MKHGMTLRRLEDAPLLVAFGVDRIVVAGEYSWLSKTVFNCDQLRQLLRVGVEVVVKVNRFYFETELAGLKAYMQELAELGVQWLLFHDLGVVMLNRELGSPFSLIYDADTMMTSDQDTQLMLALGIDEVILARELTAEEYQKIIASTPGRLGLHGFGYPLMSVSRKPHIQAYYRGLGKPQPDVDRVWLKERSRHELYLAMDDPHGNAIYHGKVVSLLAAVRSWNTEQLCFYWDDLGLNSTVVCTVLKQYRQGASDQAIAALLDEAGIESDEGLLRIRTVLTKEDGR